MPIIITPSDRSEKLWPGLAEWPVRFDIAFVIVSLYTAFFSLAFGVFELGVGFDSFSGVTDDSLRLIMQLLPPFVTAVIASFTFWLHVYRTLNPALSVATSIFILLGWAGSVFFWIPDITMIYFSDTDAWRVLGIAKMVGAALNFGFAVAYLVFACRAVHRLRRAKSSSHVTESCASSEHELDSRRHTPMSLIGTSIVSTGTSIRCTSLGSEVNSVKAVSESDSMAIAPPSYRTVAKAPDSTPVEVT